MLLIVSILESLSRPLLHIWYLMQLLLQIHCFGCSKHRMWEQQLPKSWGGGAEPFASWTGRPAPKFWPTAGGRGKFRCWTSSSQRVGGGQLFGSWTYSTEIWPAAGGRVKFRCWTSSSQRVGGMGGTLWELDVQHRNFGPPLAVGENFGAGRPAPKALEGGSSLGAGRPAPKFWPTAGGRGKFRCWTSSSQRVGGRALWELDVQHRNFGPLLAVGENFGAGRPAPKGLGGGGGTLWELDVQPRNLGRRWRSGKTSVLDVQRPKGWGIWGGGAAPFASWTSSTEMLAHRWRSGKISVLDVQLPKGWRGETLWELDVQYWNIGPPLAVGEISVLDVQRPKGWGIWGERGEPFGSWTSSTVGKNFGAGRPAPKGLGGGGPGRNPLGAGRPAPNFFWPTTGCFPCYALLK